MKKTLTIALLTYNRSAYLKLSLQAILDQTYEDFEVLVFDNASTDDTCEVVKGFVDPRLVYVRQPEGGTSGHNWGTAVFFARGEYVLVTHDDDIMEPTMVEKQMALLRAHPQLLGVATNVSLMDEHGKILQPFLHPPGKNRIFKRGEYIGCYLEEKVWLPASTYLFRKDILQALAGGARPVVQGRRVKFVESMAAGDIWGTCWMNTCGPIALLGEPLLRYRQHAGQDCRNVDHTYTLVELFKTMKRFAKVNPVMGRYRTAIEAWLIRFEAQGFLLNTLEAKGRNTLVRNVKRLKTHWEAVIPPRERARDGILPFEILTKLLGCGSSLPHGELGLGRLPAPHNGAQSGFRTWYLRLMRGESLFPVAGRPRRIAILGSMLAGYLIALDAAAQGIEVACCLDSSPSRQGRSLVGIPIEPFSWLDANQGSLDAIVLSSELGQEEVIRGLLQRHLSQHQPAILSWKDLAVDPLGDRIVNS